MNLFQIWSPRASGLLRLGFILFSLLLSQWSGAEGGGDQQQLYRFRKAQSEERRVLFHQEKSELQALKQSQELRFKEWNEKENAARREYFSNHAGPEKRTYMQSLKLRRSALQKEFKDQRAARAKEMEERLRAQRSAHAQKLQQFREYLQRGELPPQALWPVP